MDCGNPANETRRRTIYRPTVNVACVEFFNLRKLRLRCLRMPERSVVFGRCEVCRSWGEHAVAHFRKKARRPTITTIAISTNTCGKCRDGVLRIGTGARVRVHDRGFLREGIFVWISSYWARMNMGSWAGRLDRHGAAYQ